MNGRDTFVIYVLIWLLGAWSGNNSNNNKKIFLKKKSNEMKTPHAYVIVIELERCEYIILLNELVTTTTTATKNELLLLYKRKMSNYKRRLLGEEKKIEQTLYVEARKIPIDELFFHFLSLFLSRCSSISKKNTEIVVMLLYKNLRASSFFL